MNIDFNEESRVVIIMRGVPGSGKSTAVAALQCFIDGLDAMPLSAECSKSCSADHFFMTKKGEYHFKPRLLPKAHKACQDSFNKALEEQKQLVIVDNTNIMSEHIRPYVDAALAQGYEVFQWEMTGNFESVHGVPEAAVRRMRHTYEPMHLPKFEPGTALTEFMPNPSSEAATIPLKI